VYRRQVRRRRVALALLVAASLALLSTYFGESAGGFLHTLQRGALVVLGPLEEGANRAFKPASDLIGWVDDTFEAKGRNQRLEREVAELRGRLAAAETATSENTELRALAGIAGASDFMQGRERVTARVIGRSPSVWYSTVTIDKGSSAGLAVDQPVLGGGGLAGRVSTVTRGTAQITLITDHTSAVSAQVVPTGVGGVVRAAVGDPDDLLLDFIEKGRRVRKGQTVVTSGTRSEALESLFPRGVPIGKVVEATIEEQETYQRVHVEPFAGLRDLDFVQVLVPAGSGGRGARADREGES